MSTPAPGIYEDVPFADYLAWDAISNSKLSLLKKSPRHFKLACFKEPTKPMQLGQLYHCGVLEPLMFADRYAICPDYHLYAENSTKDGTQTTSKNTIFVRESIAEFARMSEGREIVPTEWYQQTLALVKELTLNEDARRLLNDSGPRELSIVWEEGGILHKARLDKVAERSRAIVDLKSTGAIESFTNAIGRYGYHRQMAHYQAGWKELTGDTLTPWLIAVESSEPFAVQAAPLNEESLAIGRTERRELLDDLRECMESDSWPPMANPKHWIVPAWVTERDPVELIMNGQSIEV